MNKSKTDKAVDRAFLIFLVAVSIGLLISIAISGKTTADAAAEPTKAPKAAATVRRIKETAEAMPEAAEPAATLYNVPLEEDLQVHIINLCEEKHIDPAIVFAMAWKESTYRPRAIGDSGKSFGLLQIQQKWHSKRMQKLGCTDLLDPYQNVTVGVDYLCELLNRYDGDIGKALTAYNRGHYPGFISNYAKKVMAKAEELRGETYVL